MNKEIRKTLIVLALYSFAGGLFYYFQEFWMAENNLSTKTIGIVLSLCSLITCSVIFLCSNLITPSRLKKVTRWLLIVKSVLLFFLFLLYGSNQSFLIKFIIMIEYAIDTELLVLFYPLMSLINKSDKIYGLRDIIYQSFYYLGSLIVILTLNKYIFSFKLTYNTFLLFSVLLSSIAAFLIHFINTPILKIEKTNNDILIKLIKKIKTDSISKYYLCYSLLASISMYIVIGLFLTILVNKMGYSENTASIFKLIAGILGSVLATIILIKITFKNNYLNVGIKYFGRIFFCVIAVLFPNKYNILNAIIFIALSFSWYSHVAEAPYINRYDKDEQLPFANLSEMIVYLGRAIGTLLCGVLYLKNIRFNFGVSIFFTLIAIFFAYKALYLKNKELKNDRK